MPGAVADSSTLISLAAIGRLSFLREFHGTILIPPAVWREVVVEGQDRPGAKDVEEAEHAGWIKVVPPTNRDLVKSLERELDEGEAEAIALAVEQKADVIFLDESEARKIAAVYNLPVAGVVGVLLKAKFEGKISSVRAELECLLQKYGFRLAEPVYRRVLQEAGEDRES
jgi:predicted nucleic acid-binding protein